MRFNERASLDPSQVSDRRGLGMAGGLAAGGGGISILALLAYLLLLATIGVGFIIAGVLFAAARMNSMKRQLRNDLPERIAEEPRRSASETSEA